MKHPIGVFFACLVLAFFGCSSDPEIPEPEAPPPEPAGAEPPAVSAAFENQLLQFLGEGAKTTAMAAQGLPYGDFLKQMVNTRAAYDLVLSIWPGNFAADAKNDFGKAIQGWQLALELWGLRISQGDNPTEPDINGFDQYTTYALKELKFETYGKDYLVADYRGRYYLPFDANIGVLLEVAGKSFDTARARILSALDNQVTDKSDPES